MIMLIGVFTVLAGAMLFIALTLWLALYEGQSHSSYFDLPRWFRNAIDAVIILIIGGAMLVIYEAVLKLIEVSL